MRPLLPVILILSAWVSHSSCKKSSGDQPLLPPASTRLASIRGTIGPDLFRVDTFIYDPQGNLVMQKEWPWQNGKILGDSMIISFTYAAGRKEPSSYTLTDTAGTAIYTLSYDNQGRVIKDTAGPDPGGKSGTMTYTNNYISYFSRVSGKTDTFFVSSGNLTAIAYSAIPYNYYSYYVNHFVYTPVFGNPFYYTGQTDNVRLLLTKIHSGEVYYNDYFSKYAYTHVSNFNDDDPVQFLLDGSNRVTAEMSFTTETLKFGYQ